MNAKKSRIMQMGSNGEKKTCCPLSNFLESFQSSRLFGMLLMAFAGLFLTISNLFVQLAIESNKRRIPTLEIVIARSAVQLILVIPFLVFFRVKLILDKESIGQILIMGISGFLSVTFIYLGIDKIPLGDATVITFTSPVFTMLFAYAMLSESCSLLDCICGVISFAGVILAARPNFIFGERDGSVSVMFHKEDISKERKETIYIMGVGYVLLGAIFLSLYYVLTRKIGHQQHFLVNIFYPSLFGSIFVPLMMIPHDDFILPGCWKSSMYILLVGVTAFTGLVLLAVSLKLEHAGPLILIRNLDIIYAFVLQYCFTRIAPSWWSISGGLVIVTSTSIIVGKRWLAWEKRRNKFSEDIDEEAALMENDNFDKE